MSCGARATLAALFVGLLSTACDRHADNAPKPNAQLSVAGSGQEAVAASPAASLDALGAAPHVGEAGSVGDFAAEVTNRGPHDGERLQPGSGSVRIHGVEYYPELDAARVVLHLTGAAAFHARRAGRAELHVDIEQASVDSQGKALGGILERAAFVPLEGGVRLVLNLAAEAEQNVFYLPAPFRIVVDVSRSVVAKAENSSRRIVERVALDPGHGGSDPGAIGPTGAKEKDIALDIAHRAAPLLARELGASTLLTRDQDVFVPLEQRVAKANAFRADLFISIHCNADPSNMARGVMAFVLDGSDNLAQWHVTTRENLIAAGAQAPELRAFLEQFDDGVTAGHSLVLARLLQRASQASLAQGYPGTIDGGVHGAGFHVLAGARMPAVLFEASFISNALEEERLNSPRYRQKLADSIVNAVRAYRAGYH